MSATSEGNTGFKRLSRRDDIGNAIGTPLVAADFALSAGFGTTAAVAPASGSNDMAGQITITSSGTGQAANPTATLTFKDKSWLALPVAVATRGSAGNQLAVPVVVTCTLTTMVITFVGTPVAAETYVINYHVIG